LNFLF